MGRFDFMKTKIIYISGGEIFNMNDVRDAFDTVRRELQLPNDTVLFGVPVDADDALGTQFETDTKQNTTVETVDVQPDIDEVVPVEQPEKPKRAKKKAAKVIDIVEDVKSEAVVEQTPEKEVIPILSVLGGETKPVQTEITPVEDSLNDEIVEDSEVLDIVEEKTSEPVVNITDLSDDILIDEPEQIIVPQDDQDVSDIQEDIPTVEPQTATVLESDDEDDQLAKLLESVQSLNEDKDDTAPELQVVENTVDETDATLEKLATEFAENQDKIINTTKSSARGGRIGKLKNILPFKKTKRNESSLMGDLFGWAGVAANDEEFGIPEFFPTAAKK